MPKPSDDIQDLKRRLARLDRLDGRALACADGVFLITPGTVSDPRPLVTACVEGRPTSAAIAAAMSAGAAPVQVGPALLAAAQRDLKTLEVAPALAVLAREVPRLFRRYGDLDARWIADKRARVDHLAELLRRAAAPEDGRAWFDRVMEIVGLLHGDLAVTEVLRAQRRLVDDARARRSDARRALAEVLAAIAGGDPPRTGAAVRAVRDLRAAASRSGRSRAKRVVLTLRELFDLPPGAADHGLADPSLPLPEQVRAAGERLLAGIASPNGPDFRERAQRFFAAYALAFDPGPRDGHAPAIRPEQLDRGLAELPSVVERFGGKTLGLSDVLALLDVDLGKHADAVIRLVEAGLPVAKVVGMAALGKLGEMATIRDAAAAGAYADWALALVPHYAKLGLDVPISPAMFATLRGTRKDELAVLAVCLMKHHGRAGPEGAEQAAQRLDATLGLFRHRPAEAEAVLGRLSGTAAGAGRAAFPDFAAWLDDDAVLDRVVHLTRLAGLPVTLSRTLRSDFERGAATGRERAYLVALALRSPAQEQRLAKLEADKVARPGSAWTRRRLAERAGELAALAYDAQLDGVFRRLVQEVWGISLARLTPGWRDAIRFHLAVDKNRELLGTVLRSAAGGADLARALPRNKAWIAEVAGRFDVEAWLAPRSREVVIGGEKHRLVVERDPVEVLRMGIPFGTCLALDTGVNAASTVINAADANKRVLYLRDSAGSILGRKLIAVSDTGEMLGYHLYVAAKEKHAPIAAAVRAMCAEIAAATGLPLASSGKPKQLHEGFWYDDGAEPFDGAAVDSGVAAYCASLGRPAPGVVGEDLRREAEAFAALAAGDVARVGATLAQGWQCDGPRARAAEWLVPQLPPGELIRAARNSTVVATVALRLAAAEGPVPMLQLAARIGEWRSGEDAAAELSRFPRTTELAVALVEAAGAHRRGGDEYDDHGLQHQTMYLIPAYVAEMPLAAALALCDRVEPLWAWVTAQAESCGVCRDGAVCQTIDAIVQHYASARDPEAVLHGLQRPRSSLLARRAALRIAATYALAAEAAPPSLPPPGLQPVLPCPEAMRALAKLRRRAPELEADPDLFAALLRQSGGAPPSHLTLPKPREAPFEALGDLLAQRDLAAVLGPWLEPSEPRSSWQPGPWELYFHRRHATPLRAALVAEAMRSPLPSRATDALARLGDVEGLDAVFATQRRPEPPRRSPRPAPVPGPAPLLSHRHRAEEVSRFVAAQVAAADGAASLASGAAAARGAHLALGRDGVDPGLLVEAFATIERLLGGARDDDADLAAAFDLSVLVNVPTPVLQAIFARLVTRPEGPLATAPVRAFVLAFLRGHPVYLCPDVPPELVVALTRYPDIAPVIFEALAKTLGERFEPALRAVLDEARRHGGEEAAGSLFERWTAAVLDRKAYDLLVELDDEALFQRALELAIARDPAAAVLHGYPTIRSHARAAAFLSALERCEANRAPAVRAALAGLAEWGAEDDYAARYAWLRASVKGR